MKHRINVRMCLVGLIATVLTATLVTVSLYRISTERAWNQLKDMTQVFANNVENMDTIKKMGGGINNHYRVTVIENGGNVSYDSRVSTSKLDNHNSRKEVVEAREKGSAEVVRISDTVGKNTYYYAISVGQNRVLRMAMDTDSIMTTFRSVVPLIILVAFCAFIICFFISKKLTRGLLKPISEMAAGNLNVTYPELQPFAESIKERQAVEKMKQEFTANVSHELKTPLTSISGYAELIETGMAKPEDIKKFATKIHTEAGRLIILIGDIMQLSELEEPGSLCEFAPVELWDVAEQTKSSLEIPAKNKEIDLEILGKPVTVLGDRKLLGEVIYNLCDNAIRYNRIGGHVLVELGENQDSNWIRVTDNGIGIPKEKQEHVFRRFYRVDKSRSKETGGTGLGLSIVKHICELHGAEIKVDSDIGQGTAITVSFPNKK